MQGTKQKQQQQIGREGGGKRPTLPINDVGRALSGGVGLEKKFPLIN